MKIFLVDKNFKILVLCLEGARETEVKKIGPAR